MGCTTILAGIKATYDGSTMIARNDDSGAEGFTPKRLEIVTPERQPRHYRSVLSHVEVDLPDNPMRYSAVPNALEGRGIWAGAGVNAANVAMTATETICSNERVLGADPLVFYIPADGDEPEQPGGIGEEDLVTLVLPYIRSAREGVLRTGELLARYGTYEMNGIAFSDVREIWWMETIGGHHWIARRVPDDRYVVMPNQSGIDHFDLADAFGEKKEYLCSPDLREWMRDNYLDLTMDPSPCTGRDGEAENNPSRVFNPRDAFGTHTDADRLYNTPRAWYICRCLNPRTYTWDGPEAEYGPMDDDLPWSLRPEKKITVEDIKYLLSSHFQGTPHDPYGTAGDEFTRRAFRTIGINRTDFLALLQLRPYMPEEICALEWLTYGSNAFNSFAPLYPNVGDVPAYLSRTCQNIETDSFYWNCRLLGVLADAQFQRNKIHVERYQIRTMARAHEILNRYDKMIVQKTEEGAPDGGTDSIREAANEELAAMMREETREVLSIVLDEASKGMKNAYDRSDA